MSKVIVTKEKLDAIADAIRESLSTSTTYTLDSMPEAIRSINSPYLYNFEWDGNIEGKVAVDIGGGAKFYKVSSVVLSAEDIIGGTIVVNNGGEHKLTEDALEILADGNAISGMDAVLVAKQDNIVIEDESVTIIVPEKGIYLMKYGQTYAAHFYKEK